MRGRRDGRRDLRRHRRPAVAQLAEVTITLDETAGAAPPPFHEQSELEIIRRIERGSGSEYRVNGKEVRARDVQTLFADLATGAHASGMVSQGRVGALVTARPEDRRAVMEEAAGITGLHARRHEAELKLRAAETNLARADDLRGQLEVQLGALKRQARQASRYRNISGAIRAGGGGAAGDPARLRRGGADGGGSGAACGADGGGRRHRGRHPGRGPGHGGRRGAAAAARRRGGRPHRARAASRGAGADRRRGGARPRRAGGRDEAAGPARPGPVARRTAQARLGSGRAAAWRPRMRRWPKPMRTMPPRAEAAEAAVARAADAVRGRGGRSEPCDRCGRRSERPRPGRRAAARRGGAALARLDEQFGERPRGA